MIYTGDCRDTMRALIDAGTRVQMCVTSPPYFGLRDYSTGRWEGGDGQCAHAVRPDPHVVTSTVGGGKATVGHAKEGFVGTCRRCGAVRIDRQIGLEQTPEEYVANLVGVFRLVRDLLADDGTCWLNIGDSWATNRTYQVASIKGGAKHGPAQSAGGKGSTVQVVLKPKDLIGIPWRAALALQADGWWLRQDIIWCLSGGAAVYARTQKGDMPVMVKDLVRLRPETVKLWNGSKWTQVLGWNRSTNTDGALEIELRSGERIGCTMGHQWPTKRGLLKASELVAGDVIDTTRLPEPETPKIAGALGVDVAWLCGLYLAEGSMSGDKVQIAGHAKESVSRLDRIERVAASFHGSASVFTSENNASIVIYGPVIASVIRAYVHGNSAHNKGIKVRAWARSNEWLMAFLQGYLAGDGHYDDANDRWRLGFCRNDRLADDFRTLAARLGLPLRLNATTTTGFGRKWPTYRGDIRLVPTAHHNARIGSAIVAIRPSRARQFWDIGVEDDPHTFALASGVLTHNSKPCPLPESVTDRCTKSHEYLFLLAKAERYYYDADAIAEPAVKGDMGSSFTHGKTGARTLRKPGAGPRIDDGKRNRRSVWTIPPARLSEPHFAAFPPDLAKLCVLAGSRVGDTVLDPFLGSGTTGMVAESLGRKWIGCELNPEYVKIAERRTAQQGIGL